MIVKILVGIVCGELQYSQNFLTYWLDDREEKDITKKIKLNKQASVRLKNWFPRFFFFSRSLFTRTFCQYIHLVDHILCFDFDRCINFFLNQLFVYACCISIDLSISLLFESILIWHGGFYFSLNACF